MYFVYILKSLKDEKLYTGCTNNLEKRVREHSSGKVKSTACRLPLEIIYFEACENKYDAYRREKYLKSTRGKTFLKSRLKFYFENRA